MFVFTNRMDRLKNKLDSLFFNRLFVPERHNSRDGRRKLDICVAPSRKRSGMEISMKDKKNIIIILSAFAAFIALSILVSFLLNRGKQIPENDPWLSGSTAGNQYHGGLFCEQDGIVYFSNAYDSGSLYSMQPGQTELTKLNGGEILYINAGGDYLYYYSRSNGGEAGLGYIRNGRGIYRCDLNGNKTASLSDATCDGLLLLGNSLYYTNFEGGGDRTDSAVVTLASVPISGGESLLLADGHPQLGTVSNGVLYYSSMENNYTLCTYTPSTGGLGIAAEQSMYQPIIQNDIVYYLDIHDDYKLKAYSLYDGSVQTIVEERVDCFNVMGDIIYYQNCDPDHYALKRIYTDGSGDEFVMDGAFHNINMTSEYVYFTEFNNDLPVYQTPTFGAVNVTTFDAALRAAAGIEPAE